jgi:hypothetical protein
VSTVDNGSYVAFLIIGIVLVAIDGHLIYRSAVRYLTNSYTARSSATSMARLVSVLFHLVVLGVLALVSVIDFSVGGQLQTVVMRLGVLLLILAAAHGVTITILNRMRDRLDTEELTMERIERARPDLADRRAPAVPEAQVPPSPRTQMPQAQQAPTGSVPRQPKTESALQEREIRRA